MNQKMTPEQAKTFAVYSEHNAAIIVSNLDCDCKPYESIFTYNRWKAQGYQVKRGEHGIRLTTMKPIQRNNAETGEEETITIPRRATVFCRHQVVEIAKAEKE